MIRQKKDVERQPTDAWKLLDDLRRKFTWRMLVRPDLQVTALGTERAVQIGISDPLVKPHEMRRWHVTTRSLGTMRELANCINAACDFVESANPTWAARSKRTNDD